MLKASYLYLTLLIYDLNLVLGLYSTQWSIMSGEGCHDAETSNLINLYNYDNNFLIQIIIFWKSQTYQNYKSLSSYYYKILQSPTIGFI